MSEQKNGPAYLIRIESRRFVAGLELTVKSGRHLVTRTAPILQHLKNKPWSEVEKYIRRYRMRYQAIKIREG